MKQPISAVGNHRVPRLRFTREEAEAEAIRLATEFVAGVPGAESYQCQKASPDKRQPKNLCSKHPIYWLVTFVPPPEPGVVIDGGELFVSVDLETKTVAIPELF